MRVLLAYDRSDGANLALSLVRGLRLPDTSEVRVVSVMEPVLMPGPTGLGGAAQPMPSTRLLSDIEAWNKGNVEAGVERLRAAGRSAQGDMLKGRTATAIVDEVDRWRPDVVVVGSRGQGAVATLLLGSVSAEVLDHSAAPVLVARTENIKRVIFATDGSGPSQAAEAMLDWPIFDGCEIRVVSVADVLEPWHTAIAPALFAEALDAYDADLADAEARHKAVAEEAVARLRSRGREAGAEVRVGDAAGQIIDAATGWEADLIVMGSRGRTGVKRLFLGSAARNVSLSASASVLVAHARDEAQE